MVAGGGWLTGWSRCCLVISIIWLRNSLKKIILFPVKEWNRKWNVHGLNEYFQFCLQIFLSFFFTLLLQLLLFYYFSFLTGFFSGEGKFAEPPTNPNPEFCPYVASVLRILMPRLMKKGTFFCWRKEFLPGVCVLVILNINFLPVNFYLSSFFFRQIQLFVALFSRSNHMAAQEWFGMGKTMKNFHYY